MEKENITKESFVVKMDMFEKKWTEVTKKVKIISSVQKETNKLWNSHQELKEKLNKDVDTLKTQVDRLVSSEQTPPNLSKINSQIDGLATLRQNVEKTKELLTASSLAIYSTITKGANTTTIQSETFIDKVIKCIVSV